MRQGKKRIVAVILLVRNLNVPWLHLFYFTLCLSVFNLLERLPWFLAQLFMSVANIRLILSHCPSYHSLFLSNECTRVLLNKSKLKKKEKRGGEEREAQIKWKLSGLCLQAVALLPLGQRSTCPFIWVPLSYGGLFNLLRLHMSPGQDNCSQQYELNFIIPPASWLTVS